jgi:hypothetical protein
MVEPDLVERWDTPDDTTYVFHPTFKGKFEGLASLPLRLASPHFALDCSHLSVIIPLTRA